MDFDAAIKNLNKLLKEKRPKEFNGLWIKTHAAAVYRYISKNVRTENEDVDWDKVICRIDRPFQRRWFNAVNKQLKPYENQAEVNRILTKYEDKLHTFFVPLDENDKRIQHLMVIGLVRIGQKGNVTAKKELVKWVKYITDDWMDHYPQICRWKGYADEVENTIAVCMRRYRYSGSFLNYLFRTLEYSARGKPPVCSLDDPLLNGKRTRIDYVL